MIKNRILFFSALLCAFVFVSIPVFAEGTNEAQATPAENGKVPNAVVPEMVYEFSGIYEDNPVLHDFVVKNTGDAPLDILSVKPG